MMTESNRCGNRLTVDEGICTFDLAKTNKAFHSKSIALQLRKISCYICNDLSFKHSNKNQDILSNC